jgi:4-amino-4-deoxy-L-arabinose transferase-like glycosyltransferase
MSPRRERLLVLGAMAAGVAAVVVYVLATRSHPLSGDEIFYDETAAFWADGKLWWTTVPFGEAHATAWKPPIYPALLGTLYAILGDSPLRAELVQSLLAAVTVGLTWLLARRLFDPVVAVVAAWVVALFPLAFEYYGLLFPEALAIPLTLLALHVFLEREPTPRRALAAGAIVGVGLLVRPTSAFLFAGLLAAFVVAAGWRRGAALTALSLAAAVAVVAPWTVRNYVVTDGFIPISVQDGAVYGTFNPEAAADTRNRWAWRPVLEHPPAVLARRDPDLSEAKLRSGMQSFAFDYIGDHPESIAKAVFWNGIVRFWDLRPPGDALGEVKFQGRSRTVRAIGLAMHYALLPLALLALWRLRRRRSLVIPAVALAAAASLTFAVVGGTRYRAPLQPLVVVLAASLLATSRLPRRSPRATRCPGTP